MAHITNELLTVREAAALLRVSPYTIYRWVGSGRLRAVRPSPRTMRLRRSDLQSLTGDGSASDIARDVNRRIIAEAEARPLYDENGEPRRGSPMAIMKIAGILKDDPDFARAMDEVLRDRDRELIDSRSPLDELPD